MCRVFAGLEFVLQGCDSMHQLPYIGALLYSKSRHSSCVAAPKPIYHISGSFDAPGNQIMLHFQQGRSTINTTTAAIYCIPKHHEEVRSPHARIWNAAQYASIRAQRTVYVRVIHMGY